MTEKSPIPVDLAAVRRDPVKRLKFFEAFLGFGDDDWNALEQSATALGERLPQIVAAITDRLLAFEDTRRLFIGTNADDSEERLMRAEHLSRWMLTAMTEGRNGFTEFLLHTARMHTSRLGRPDRSIPPRYIVLMSGLFQATITDALWEALPDDPREAHRLSVAWNKLLIMQLELFLKEVAPSWPVWDEPERATTPSAVARIDLKRSK